LPFDRVSQSFRLSTLLSVLLRCSSAGTQLAGRQLFFHGLDDPLDLSQPVHRSVVWFLEIAHRGRRLVPL
jgi:hypothetical protein